MATSSKETNHAEVYCGKDANLKSLAELLLMVERNLEGPYAMELTLSDLMELEEQLHATLTHVRDKKVELKNLVDNIGDTNDAGISEVPPRPVLCAQLQFACVQFYMNEEKMLKEENQLLEKQIVEMKNGKDSDHPLCHPPQQATLSLLK
ncbi:hypothetical protein POTOM_014305 [Populus tomentosa]|uniref:K-box domain-containing protein n=1 Tax=Populus tomentosa TaxID=118781 RepID=A0A8X8AHX8_POPTO|nr:hypothetical protein POTOM_014305 [Populus tomentosa]